MSIDPAILYMEDVGLHEIEDYEHQLLEYYIHSYLFMYITRVLRNSLFNFIVKYFVLRELVKKKEKNV